jgi:hypothetical protein
MNTSFVIGVLLCCFAICANAQEPEKYTVGKIEAMFPPKSKPPRINSLWPSTFTMSLGIEPAIPDDFVMKAAPPESDCLGCFAWGSRQVLEGFDFKAQESAFGASKKPFLFFRLSLDVAQTGSTSFSCEEPCKEWATQIGMADFFTKKFQWGPYPVFQAGGHTQGKFIFSAWIGLNFESNVLFVRLAYPNEKGRPNEEDIALWNRFLAQTKPLPEPENFVAQGFDHEDGYTIFNAFDVKFTCIAEQRNSDNMVQVVIVPHDASTKCSIEKIARDAASTAWRHGEEIITIFLQYSAEPCGRQICTPWAVPVSVFLKHVDQFSLDQGVLRNIEGVCVVQDCLKHGIKTTIPPFLKPTLSR